MKFCGKQPEPSGKAKYSSVTDSEPVLGRKGEKNPLEGSEKNLKPCAYKRSEHESVTACLLLNEPTSCSSHARVSLLRGAPVAKASLNRAIVCGGKRETV